MFGEFRVKHRDVFFVCFFVNLRWCHRSVPGFTEPLHACKPSVLDEMIDYPCILLFVSMATRSSPADALRIMSAPWCNKNEVKNSIMGSEMLHIFLFE
jgi:hypothetical protein